MDLSGYRLEKAAPGREWDAFVEGSPQRSLFARSAFLGAIKAYVDYWYCYKKEEKRAAVTVIRKDDGRIGTGHRLAIHDGILLAQPKPAQNNAQKISEEFRTISFLVDALSSHYSALKMKFHRSFPDLRPFLWHNHGEDAPQYRPDIRYTTFLNLDPKDSARDPTACPLYANINKSRRQEIRYGIAEGIETTARIDYDVFRNFYTRTFQRQGLPPENDLDQLMAIIKALDGEGNLRMFISRTKKEEPGSIAVFGIDGAEATYLYGANNPDLRDSHTGTMVLWDGFRALAGEGISCINLEGVNSPARGYFKLSFGGSLAPYFLVSLSSNRADK